jgi:hypothetical protein
MRGRAGKSQGHGNIHHSVITITAAALMSGVSGCAAFAASDQSASPPPLSDTSDDPVSKKLQAMEQRIKTLEGQLKQKAAAAIPLAKPPNGATASYAAASLSDAPATRPSPATKPVKAAPTNKDILGAIESPVAGLAIGAYGEVRFGAMQNPAAGGQWQNGFDTARMVLLPTYAITDNIIFNAEIEFEHAGSGFDPDDKLHGTAEVEQVWIDFKISDPFNWRAPGVDLVPIGYINEHHEPTQFYSVKRPELYNGLIPSTWKQGATSVYGTIADGLSYQLQISMSLEDFGDDFARRTDANTVPPFPAGYAAGINGANALGFAQSPLGDFRQLDNSLAYAGRLDFVPPMLPGFAGSVSAYFTPDTTPRGAYDQNAGNPLGRSSLAMFDAEFRYRVPNTGLELRGEYVEVVFGDPANLRANNDTDPTNNVGKTMFGYSGEMAYHLPLGTILHSDWEAVPFFRYTYQNLQTEGFTGNDANTPTGAGQQQFYTAGIAVFPSPKLVLKATYQKVKNRDPAGAQSDSVLGGVGFFF